MIRFYKTRVAEMNNERIIIFAYWLNATIIYFPFELKSIQWFDRCHSKLSINIWNENILYFSFLILLSEIELSVVSVGIIRITLFVYSKKIQKANFVLNGVEWTIHSNRRLSAECNGFSQRKKSKKAKRHLNQKLCVEMWQ